MVSYSRLWKLLIDRKMTQSELRRAAHIAPNTMTKMRKGQPVSLEVLSRCCEVLDCNFGEIVDYSSEKEGKKLQSDRL